MRCIYVWKSGIAIGSMYVPTGRIYVCWVCSGNSSFNVEGEDVTVLYIHLVYMGTIHVWKVRTQYLAKSPLSPRFFFSRHRATADLI